MARAARLTWVALLLAAVGLSSAASADARGVSRAHARSIALRALRVSDNAPTQILFDLPHALRARTSIVDGTPSGKRKQLRVSRKAWLFWEDLAPGAPFAHPSKLLLVDARN